MTAAFRVALAGRHGSVVVAIARISTGMRQEEPLRVVDVVNVSTTRIGFQF